MPNAPQNTEEIAELLLRAYASFLDDAALDETQRDKTRSLLEGLARFVSHELWRPNTQKPAASGYPKQYNLDTAAPPTGPPRFPIGKTACVQDTSAFSSPTFFPETSAG